MAKEQKMTIADHYEEITAFLAENDAPDYLVEFMEGRLDQHNKTREAARASRKEKAGEKKDPAQADFYVDLRNRLMPVLTPELQTGAELLEQIDNVTPNGSNYIAAQVAIALRPLAEDGTVEVATKVHENVDEKGLIRQTQRTAYRLV